MRGNPDDLANQLIQKVKDFCKAEIEEMKISEKKQKIVQMIIFVKAEENLPRVY